MTRDITTAASGRPMLPKRPAESGGRVDGSLSERQGRFVEEYLAHGNASRAAERAGYSLKAAKQQGSRLLAVPRVAAAIREGRERRAERVEVKQDDVLRELKVIAFAEPGEKYRAGDKVKALDLLGKHLHMWEGPEADKSVQIVINREGASVATGKDPVETAQDASVTGSMSEPQPEAERSQAGLYGLPVGGAKA